MADTAGAVSLAQPPGQAGLLWEHTAPNPQVFPEFQGAGKTDVAVIGGGVTGVTAALFLAEAGHKVMLFDAGNIGGRASGRNGGQIVPGLKPAPSELSRRFGAEMARSMLQLAFSGPDVLFSLVDRYRIDCAATRNGWIQAAFSPASSEAVKVRAAELGAWGGRVRLLDREAMEAATGSSFWTAGLCETRAGSVQPLAYLRGLAAAAASHGAALYEHSRVHSVTPSGSTGGVLTLADGTVQARNVIIATDAYTDRLWPAIAQSYVSVSSAQIATNPLPSALLEKIIPGRCGLSETRKITYYCRVDAEGRFVIGGRGKKPDHLDEATRTQLRKAAIARFPALSTVDWPYGWACRVGMTLDDLPHLHHLSPGIWSSYGYCGRGMAMGTAMGRLLAKAVSEGDADGLAYPVTPIRRLPFHPLRQSAASLVIGWYRLRDALGCPA